MYNGHEHIGIAVVTEAWQGHLSYTLYLSTICDVSPLLSGCLIAALCCYRNQRDS